MTGFGRQPPIDATYRNLTHAGQMQLAAVRQQKCGSRSESRGIFFHCPAFTMRIATCDNSGRNY
jgi:hypothetical protein